MTVIPVWFQMDILQTLSTSLPLKNLYWVFLEINRFSNVPFQTAFLDRGEQHQFFSATISSILLSIQQACGEKYEPNMDCLISGSPTAQRGSTTVNTHMYFHHNQSKCLEPYLKVW